jgi:UDP-N-acetylglucosamine:LPS N-acetylglucosamine transferase
MKLCVGASSGGHMNELLNLLRHASSWPKLPDFYVTTLEVNADQLVDRGSIYILGEANRKQIVRAFKVLFRCLKVVVRERPDVVVTTGAMPLAFFCFLSKLLGAKIVWIDSIANVERFSTSGRFVHGFADLFITQWPDLAEVDRKAEYVGNLL